MHSVFNTFSRAPASGEEKMRRSQERIAAGRAGNKAQYLLTVEQMNGNGYPVPSYLVDIFKEPDGWIEAPQATAGVVLGAQTVYAIDCEMCLIQDGKALTRASQQIRSYMMSLWPPSPITDYLIRFSGITSCHAGAYYHDTCQRTSAPRQNNNTILESDLRALQLAHPHCIDIALIFNHPRGRPLKPGLAWLTRKRLGRTIQDRGPGGYDPKEDACASIDLHKAKIKNGPGYGEYRMDYEAIFARIARSHSRRHGPNGEGARTGGTAIVDHGNPGAWHGTSASAPATIVLCTNDMEVLDGVLDVLDRHEFVFARLMGLVDALGWVTPKASVDGLGTGSPENSSNAAEKANDTDNPQPQLALDDKDLFSTVAKLNGHLTTPHATLPARTAFILFSGHGDPRKISALATRRAEYQACQNQSGSAGGMGGSESAVGWNSADSRALEEAVIRTRMGLSFVDVKT
ncbi:hypothetical protein BJV78DRAFT_1394638 [Lactifluus subvellereus]|nr:hypothetical protein BJV78DRAFT_1394638 [Lactifluus subvellereus]